MSTQKIITYTKNLIIAVTGKRSIYREWLKESNRNFDIVLVYYDDTDFDTDSTEYVYRIYGEKFHIIKKFAESNIDLIKKYDNILMPCDDVLTNTKDINSLFEIHSKYNLWLSQPSLSGFISHEITRNQPNSLLRYTNFIESMCPIMTLNTFLALLPTFNLTCSAWGIDFLWPKKLNYPKDKIAIIDSIIVEHTRPVGINYSRFKIPPKDECDRIIKEYDIDVKFETFSSIGLINNES